MKDIKNYYRKLKNDFNREHTSLYFMEDYDESVPYLEKMEEYLSKRNKENPSNIDVVTTLSVLRMELRYSEKEYVDILKNFLETNNDILSSVEKARILTNLGFYYEDREEVFEYLLEAEKEGSPYVETYRGLGIEYFNLYLYANRYDVNKQKDYLEKSLDYFRKARGYSNEFIIEYSYAAVLFESGKCEEAREIFENLLKDFPNRSGVLLALAYCNIYLEDMEKARSYLEKVSLEVDDYQLNIDEIEEGQVWDAYYLLGDYDKFLSRVGATVNPYFILEFEHYFYVLWHKVKKEEFNKSVDEYRKSVEKIIKEIRLDNSSTEEEKNEYIESKEEDLNKFNKLIDKIISQGYKPIPKLSLAPVFGCYLVDCIRHKF